MLILGIHDGHSSAAALMENGRILAAAQEERLTRCKNQGGFPRFAVREVLDIARRTTSEVDGVAFSTHAYRNTMMRNREDVLSVFGRMFGPPAAVQADPYDSALAQRRKESRISELRSMGVSNSRIHFMDHHSCHAASAYFGYGSRGEDVLVLTCDGLGDGVCASVSRGQRGTLQPLAQVPLQDSVGAIYSFITYLLGLVPLEHEYKLMGLAPYAQDSGRASEIAAFFESLFEPLRPDSMIWHRRHDIGDVHDLPPEIARRLAFCRFDDVAAGLQTFVERFLCSWVQNALRLTGLRRLACAGGVFMNVKLNKRILELPEVDDMFVFPSCGDESNAFGAAWLLQSQVQPLRTERLGDIYFGREYSGAELEEAVARYEFCTSATVSREPDIDVAVARLLASGEVVARFSGRMEFGARALGNRSILAPAAPWRVVTRINRMIKQRDFWMPFAPALLVEDAHQHLRDPKMVDSPYMMFAFNAANPANLEAVTHPYDGSCRPQIVTREHCPSFHRLLTVHKELTGVGVVLNTSLNLHGHPIVNRPEEALGLFSSSGIDHLALGHLLVRKATE